jgi:hypothetical protein
MSVHLYFSLEVAKDKKSFLPQPSPSKFHVPDGCCIFEGVFPHAVGVLAF